MKYLSFAVLLFVAVVSAVGQQTVPSPTPMASERVSSEEIVLNVAAFDRSGKPARSLHRDDLVIVEDGRLHQATNVRRVPASVLIALDTGGESRQRKNIAVTRQVASRVLDALSDESLVSIVQFHDRVEFLASWSNDRSVLSETIRSRTNFGKRSWFTSAIDEIIPALDDAPTMNRHLVLITDGLDARDLVADRAVVLRRALMVGIVVHVISYTQIEFEALTPQAKIWRKGEPKPHDFRWWLEYLRSTQTPVKLLLRLKHVPAALIWQSKLVGTAASPA